MRATLKTAPRAVNMNVAVIFVAGCEPEPLNPALGSTSRKPLAAPGRC
jgi:hypothetical protein